MDLNSTSKILASMIGKTKSNEIDSSEVSPSEGINVPQVKLNTEMENVLTNILGLSSSKKHTPME